jgi:hypothetical protein
MHPARLPLDHQASLTLSCLQASARNLRFHALFHALFLQPSTFYRSKIARLAMSTNLMKSTQIEKFLQMVYLPGLSPTLVVSLPLCNIKSGCPHTALHSRNNFKGVAVPLYMFSRVLLLLLLASPDFVPECKNCTSVGTE